MAEIGELPSGWSTFTSGCEDCIPVAPDGIEELDVLFDAGIDSSSRYSWSFIEPNPGGELVYMAATNSPFVVNAQLYLSTNGVTTDLTSSFPAGNIEPMSNLEPGTSDRPLFITGLGEGTIQLFGLEDGSGVTFDFHGHGYDQMSIRTWSVNGDLLFSGGEELVRDTRLIVAKHNMTGTWLADVELEAGLLGVATIHYDGEFVYVMGHFDANTYKLYRYDIDFNLVAEFALATTIADEPYLSAFNLGQHTYLLKRRFGTPDSEVAVSYVDNMTSQIVLDEDILASNIPGDASPGVLWAMTDPTDNKTYLYFGKAGSPLIYKYGPIECAS